MSLPWKKYPPRKKLVWGYGPTWAVNIKKSLEEDMKELGFTEEEIKKAVEKYGKQMPSN